MFCCLKTDYFLNILRHLGRQFLRLLKSEGSKNIFETNYVFDFEETEHQVKPEFYNLLVFNS